MEEFLKDFLLKFLQDSLENSLKTISWGIPKRTIERISVGVFEAFPNICCRNRRRPSWRTPWRNRWSNIQLQFLKEVQKKSVLGLLEKCLNIYLQDHQCEFKNRREISGRASSEIPRRTNYKRNIFNISRSNPWKYSITMHNKWTTFLEMNKIPNTYIPYVAFQLLQAYSVLKL